MDYCNKYALCKAKELKALKYSILPTSERILADGRWKWFQHNRTWLLFRSPPTPLLQEKVKIYLLFLFNCIVF